MQTNLKEFSANSKESSGYSNSARKACKSGISSLSRTKTSKRKENVSNRLESPPALTLAATNNRNSNRGTKQPSTFPPKSKTGEKGTNTRKTLINLDWLDLKLSAGNLSLESFNQYGQTFFYHKNEAYRLDLLPFGGKTYRSKADVFYGNAKLGTIEFDSIFENLAKTAKFHVENSAFYDEWAGICLASIIENFTKAIGSTVQGVLRVDVALDGRQFENLGWNVYYHDILPIRQSSMKGGHWTTDKEHLTRVTTGFSYGSRSSGRLFRCYNKALEIRKSNHKFYILDYWNANNLDQMGGDVWRLEAELRSDFLKTVDGFTWEHLFDKKRLLSLFQVATKNFFEFVDMRVAEGAKNAAQRKKRFQRAEKIQVVDFSEVHTETYQRVKAESKPKTDRTAKIMIKQLALSAALTSENEPEKALNYAKAAGLLMEENNLEDYVMKKTHFWAPQIEREAWRRGKGVNSMLDLVNLATSLQNLQNIYV